MRKMLSFIVGICIIFSAFVFTYEKRIDTNRFISEEELPVIHVIHPIA